jgi:hypothetical protein
MGRVVPVAGFSCSGIICFTVYGFGVFTGSEGLSIKFFVKDFKFINYVENIFLCN